MPETLSSHQRPLAVLAALLQQDYTSGELAALMHTTPRTLLRDLDAINAVASLTMAWTLSRDPQTQRYHLDANVAVTPASALVISKVLLASQALAASELFPLLATLIHALPTTAATLLKAQLQNEQFHYPDPPAAPKRRNKLWRIAEAVQAKQVLTGTYIDAEAAATPPTATLTGLPVALKFDHYYWFVTIRLADHSLRTLRTDWWHALEAADSTIQEAYAERYQIGVKRQQQAFAYEGAPCTITFDYYGYPGYVFSEFPDATILSESAAPANPYPFLKTRIQITCEYSAGVRLWLLGQTPILTVVSPARVVTEIKALLRAGLARYDKQ